MSVVDTARAAMTVLNPLARPRDVRVHLANHVVRPAVGLRGWREMVKLRREMDEAQNFPL